MSLASLVDKPLMQNPLAGGGAPQIIDPSIITPRGGAPETDDPIMREDIVRVGAGSTDLRYRPEFAEWAMVLTLEYDSKALTQEAILNLIDRAGVGVGLGEWRPEKGGEYGRFEVDVNFETLVSTKAQFAEQREAA